MNMSIFDVVGPIMVGPSSSHTAGAARLARVAKSIVAKPFKHVTFGLHGSFAQTYKGHGTDKALVAGALGMRENDERLVQSFVIAQEQGLTYAFYETELEDVHENTVEMTFFLTDGEVCRVTGSSVGGGRIIICKINEFEIEFDALLPTLIVRQKDKKGVISKISAILAELDMNIGIMKLSRTRKGEIAFCVIEMDEQISDCVVEQIQRIPEVLSILAINPETEES